jgi:dihydroorotate dehydrogenase
MSSALRQLRFRAAPIALRSARPSFHRQPLPLPLQSTRQSSTQPHKTDSQLVSILKNALVGTTFALFLAVGYYTVTDTRFTTLHRHIVVPLLRYIYPDGEEAHHAGNNAMKKLHQFGLHIRERGSPDAQGDLAVTVFGHTLWNPVGTSAGIDKGAEVPDELLLLGGAYVEVGGIVPRPQEGNPRPRLFRVVSQNALINRFGLNSEGADRVAVRLRNRVREFAHRLGLGSDAEAERKVLDGEAGVPPGSLVPGKLMGVQIGKNKDTPDDIDSVVKDYVYCVEKLSRYADVIVVNVSSPNTEGLRDLQAQGPLTKILTAVVKATKATDRKTKPAVMVKVSPDEDSQAQVDGICQAIWDSGVDGVIVGNTTKQRPSPLPLGYELPDEEKELMKETGGYSGPQLFNRTVNLVRRYRQTLDQGLEKHDAAPKVIFGSGGITNGKQALEVLNAGADMVQIYTA